MSSIDEVVSVQISAETVTPTRQGFGTPLVLSFHSVFTDSHRIYSSTQEMVTDGFVSADAALQMARAIFAQNPSPSSIVVGRMSSSPEFEQVLTITSAVEGAHIKAKVVSPVTGVVNQLDYTVGPAETTTTVAAAVELLIEAYAGVTASALVADITIVPDVTGKKVAVYDLVNCKVEEVTALPVGPALKYSEELSALQIENDDWYFILTDSSSADNIADVATWVSDQKKLFFAQVQSSDVLGDVASNFAEDLALAENDRVVLINALNPVEQIQAGWVGLGCPQVPGSITWSLKTIKNASPSNLTSTQRSNLEGNNVNHYTRIAGIAGIAGINVTRNGTVSSGEYIDIVHGLDALEASIKEDVFGLLATNPKVPYTGGGLDLVQNAILGALRRFEGEQALLVPQSSFVIMPSLASISTGDKAARRLTGVKFQATLAGAIHSVQIVGTVTL